MISVFAITTHHERPEEAADAWRINKVCAIGWSSYGNLSKTKNELDAQAKLFMRIKKGDVILAYATRNRIALVGEVDGKFVYNPRNEVGRKGDDGFGYANQYDVSWWNEPYDFDRKNLPPYFADQVGKPYKTIEEIKLGRYSLAQFKDIIRSNALSGSKSPYKEDAVKFGIRNFLGRNIDSLEKGMRITKAERAISETDRPDFLAEDRSGKMVVIECKSTANSDNLEQLERYGRTYKAARLFLVAFYVTGECKEAAKKNPRIEIFECGLTFTKL